MCPVHSEHVLVRYLSFDRSLCSILIVFCFFFLSQPKKRVPRQTTVVNIEERGIPNNGDIIVQPPPERPPPEEYEEMTVNRIRYQVPEQNIILDFWGKIAPPSRRNGETGRKLKKRASPRKKRAAGNGYESGSMSPLTDLTSSEDEDVEMADSRPSKSRLARATSTPAPSLLDNLALLAEVRYIDLLNNTNNDSSAAKPSSSTSQNAPVPSTSAANSSSSSASSSVPAPPATSSGTPRFSVPSIPPFNAGTASPTSTSIPLSGANRRSSPSLSPAPVGSTASRGTTPQAELTVQSKEDLKALMQVRKLLLSQGQAQGTAKTTMLSFLEGAPIIVR